MKKGNPDNAVVVAYLLMSLCVAVVSLIGVGYSWLARKDFEVVAAGDMKIKAPDGFYVTEVPTPNVGEGRNRVEGIVLHHTATESKEKSLKILTDPDSGVSCHVLIDKDGSRYVLAPPEAITWHAGRSRLNGKEGCNNFTVGIEFQGNTLEEPLTQQQVESALEYVIPIMSEYDIPAENIVTHERIRTNYKEAHPGKKVHPKVDVTPEEWERFMVALKERIGSRTDDGHS